MRKGLRALKNSFETILEERKDEISPRMRRILIGLYGDWIWMDDRIDKVSKEIEEISRRELCKCHDNPRNWSDDFHGDGCGCW